MRFRFKAFSSPHFQGRCENYQEGKSDLWALSHWLSDVFLIEMWFCRIRLHKLVLKTAELVNILQYYTHYRPSRGLGSSLWGGGGSEVEGRVRVINMRRIIAYPKITKCFYKHEPLL